jgi:hypothetical protein
VASLNVAADGSRSGTVSSTSQLILALPGNPASTQVHQLVDDVAESSTRTLKPLIYKAFFTPRHSHSIVAGGLLLTSYTTRLMPRTSLMMRLLTLFRSA